MQRSLSTRFLNAQIKSTSMSPKRATRKSKDSFKRRAKSHKLVKPAEKVVTTMITQMDLTKTRI